MSRRFPQPPGELDARADQSVRDRQHQHHQDDAEQELPGAGETIEYEDEKGIWHVEFDPGTDRPATEVADD